MDLLSEAKRIANEAVQLAERVEQEQSESDGAPAPTNYSSSVTSCTVDPETGNISLSVCLYPGDTPIQPEPPADAETPVVPADTDAPPGQVPAQ